MKYGLSKKQLDEIIRIIADFTDVEEAVLFGSRAIDTFKEASDVDIAIKGKKVSVSLAAKLKYQFEEETYLPFFCDFVAWSTITNEELKKHIRDKGVVIYRKVLSEWKKCKLLDVAENFAMGPFGSNIKAENFVESGVPVIRGKNLNYHRYVGGDYVFLCDEKANQLKSSNCFPGDLVFTHRGTIGQVGLIPEGKYPRYVVSQSGMKLSVKKDILNSNFLLYFFKSNIGQHELLQNESQVGVPAISSPLTSLKSVNIFLPPLSEQNTIVSVLSSLDDKIDLLHRQNKTLEAMAETLFRQWFVEEAKEDWEEGCLEDIASFHNGKKRPGDIIGENIPIYGGNGILGYSEKFNYEGTTVIIGRVGAYCGSLYIEHKPIWVSDNALVAKPINNKYSSFLFFLLKHLSLNEMSEGSSHPLLTQTLLKSIPILLPPAELVESFIFQVDVWLNKIDFSNNQIRTLEKLRDTLLPKLMCGEVCVEMELCNV